MAAKEKSDPTDPDGVRVAKANFLSRASEIDPLAPVRKHPFVMVGAASMLGAVAATPALEKSVLLTKAIDRLLTTSLPLANQFLEGLLAAIQPKDSPSEQTDQSEHGEK